VTYWILMCLSGKKLSPEEQKQKDQSKALDQEIKQEASAAKKHLKLLLLGTGDSGKSTFAKQMSLIHNKGGLSDQYIDTFIPTLRDNALSGMQFLIKHINETETLTMPQSVSAKAQSIFTATELTHEVAQTLVDIWNDKDFKDLALSVGDDAQLQGGISGVKYYFENAPRFAKKDYKPTKEDMLKARRKTTGIVETQFTVGNNIFTMVDVGGQRSERKKNGCIVLVQFLLLFS